MPDRDFGIETLCLHAGQLPDPATGARAAPIYQTTSYVFDSADHAASLFNLQTFGNVYTRLMNPTNAVFEERMAALEGGRAALAVSSGMAAQTTALLTLMQAGDELVSASTLYGGTYSQLDFQFRRLGIETRFVDPDDPENFRRALTPKTRALYAETIGNPLNNVLDIEAVGAIARDAGVPLVIDNTFATPYLCRPIEHGADIVVHSATKFIGGHGTSIGGVIVESGRFPWDNGNFPGMTEPSKGYHGVRFYETFGDFGFTMKARMRDAAHPGTGVEPVQRFPVSAGARDVAGAHGSPLRQRARRGRVPARARGGGMGALRGSRRQPVSRAGEAIPAARSRVDSDLRHPRRSAGGHTFHRGRGVHEPPGQRRRRQDAGDSPRLDDAPSARRGGAAQRRRDAGHDPHLRGARDPR